MNLWVLPDRSVKKKKLEMLYGRSRSLHSARRNAYSRILQNTAAILAKRDKRSITHTFSFNT
jgi:hypothetical protein